MINFIITCHGWSASNWLAYVLNEHPDMVVSHSAANLINEKLSNDIQSKIQEFHAGYLNRTERSISESYEKIRLSKKAKVYGSVHLYRLRDLPIQAVKFGIDGGYTVCNLVRNPIDLVWSGYGQFKELFLTDINELHWTLGKILEDKDFCYEVAEKYDLKLGSYEVLAFIGAARVLGSLKLDLDAQAQLDSIQGLSYQGQIKMEELTQEPSALLKLIATITDDQIEVNEEYLQSIYKVGRINSHKQDIKSLKGAQRYLSLEPWQKDIIDYYLSKYDIVRAYSMMGYDLSFVKNSSEYFN